MPSPERLAVVLEGKALLYIPDPTGAVVSGRVEPAWLDVFYNPAMEFNRDLSVALYRVLLEEGFTARSKTVLDAHTGTGVRGVRYLLESGFDTTIMCDINPKAARLAALNARINKLDPGSYYVYNSDSNTMMHRLRKEIPTPIAAIEIDPYGSPAPFIDAAVQLAGKRSIISLTATDLAVLEGGKRRAAIRRYLLNHILKTPVSKETGIRVLLGFIARFASIYDKSIKPLMSYYADHYYRVYVLVERGASRSDEMIEKNLGYILFCKDLGVAVALNTPKEAPCNESKVVAYPAWTGPLGDPNLASLLADKAMQMPWLSTRKRIVQLARTLEKEYMVKDGSIYHSLTSIASALKVNTPKRAYIIEKVEELGFKAADTHFSSEGIRTNAPIEVLTDLVRILGSRKRNKTNP